MASVLKSLLGVSLILAGLAFATPAAHADESDAPITVKVNMARILRIGAPASTVVVGNPGVADVTIQDPRTLVLTGKSYGQTNMIVLDAKGNPIADTLVEVVQAQANTVAVYNAGARSTYSCAPTCMPMIMLGDSSGYSQELSSSMNVVQGAAQ
jgi:Flp pilus assembly secretin CpaC